MKKIMIIISLLLLLTGCKSNPEISDSNSVVYDSNKIYKTLNEFTRQIRNEDYESARYFYKNGENYETLAFSSFIRSQPLGQAIENGNTVSYTIQNYNTDTGLTKISFIYNDERYYITVDISDYRIILEEGN